MAEKPAEQGQSQNISSVFGERPGALAGTKGNTGTSALTRKMLKCRRLPSSTELGRTQEAAGKAAEDREPDSPHARI